MREKPQRCHAWVVINPNRRMSECSICGARCLRDGRGVIVDYIGDGFALNLSREIYEIEREFLQVKGR